MKRLFPQSIAGRLIALLLCAIVVAQIATGLLFYRERREVLSLLNREFLVGRIVAMVHLVEGSPFELHDSLVATASTRRLRFWISDESFIDANGTIGRKAQQLRLGLGNALAPSQRTVRIDLSARKSEVRKHHDRWSRGGERRKRKNWRWRGGGTNGLYLSVQLASGRWLNLYADAHAHRFPLRGPWLFSLLLMALAITVIVIVMIRRITKPMKNLADAADRLGRGETVAPLAVSGPREIQRTNHAFNEMRERLVRFVDGRTRTLAAISHDLRTPITSLRLRAEFVDDEETRNKIIETLDEMQRMVEATLAFAREESAEEETQSVDIGELVKSICREFDEIGHELTCTISSTIEGRCRPTALKRAIRNLTENAVTYGKRATLSADREGNDAVISIVDEGPGIPADKTEDVFEPFARLETSRNRNTGGVGLGLSIARSIVRNHGGEISLKNLEQGGLEVIVRFPVA